MFVTDVVLCVCKIVFKSQQICGCCCKMLRGSLFWDTRYYLFINKVSPRGAARRYVPPRRRWQFDPKIAADQRPSADGSALHSMRISGGRQWLSCRTEFCRMNRAGLARRLPSTCSVLTFREIPVSKNKRTSLWNFVQTLNLNSELCVDRRNV